MREKGRKLIACEDFTLWKNCYMSKLITRNIPTYALTDFLNLT